MAGVGSESQTRAHSGFTISAGELGACSFCPWNPEGESCLTEVHGYTVSACAPALL